MSHIQTKINFTYKPYKPFENFPKKISSSDLNSNEREKKKNNNVLGVKEYKVDDNLDKFINFKFSNIPLSKEDIPPSEVIIPDNILDTKQNFIPVKYNFKDSLQELNVFNKSKINDKIQKVKGYHNLAKMKLAIGLGKFHKKSKHKEVLIEREDTNRFNLKSLYLLQSCQKPTVAKQKYWKSVTSTPYFKELKSIAKKTYKLNNCYESNNYYNTKRIVDTILPNNYNINNFQNLKNKSDWKYSKNPKQILESLPLRWSGSKANFYEPFVLRFHTDDSGRRVGIQGLCPYCQINKVYKCKGYNDFFFNLANSSYEAHIARIHGVYSTGEELSPPFFVYKKEQLSSVCLDCHRINLACPEIDSNDFTVSLTWSHYKHCARRHCRRDLNKSRENQYMILEKPVVNKGNVK